MKEAAQAYNTPEAASVLRYQTGGKYWALKKNVPTVRFPIKMANTLRGWYNEKDPHVSPDEAAVRLSLRDEYAGSLYIKYVMNADKIKAFFSTLKSKKNNGVVPVVTPGNIKCNDGYGQWTTVEALKGELARRVDAGTMVKPSRTPTDKQGWAILLELNDVQQDNTLTLSDEESSHVDTEDGGEAAFDVNGDLPDENDEDDRGDDEDMAMQEAHMGYDQLSDDGI